MFPIIQAGTSLSPVYGSVTLSSLHRFASHEEPILAIAIYEFHPDSAKASV